MGMTEIPISVFNEYFAIVNL